VAVSSLLGDAFWALQLLTLILMTVRQQQKILYHLVLIEMSL